VQRFVDVYLENRLEVDLGWRWNGARCAMSLILKYDQYVVGRRWRTRKMNAQAVGGRTNRDCLWGHR
jgi:hypothetical protein